ncbi:MAG: threonine--tRNA ligase, partial [Deltaproteobacteria bacterium]|nr:threonine--tRNA ligase [Deltaproteobacteria bacterium]
MLDVEGNLIEPPEGASCGDALKAGVSGKRFKAALAARAGDVLLDLAAPLPRGCSTLAALTADEPEGLDL